MHAKSMVVSTWDQLAAQQLSLPKDSIKSVELVDFEELGMEAVRKIRVENFPAFIIVDDKGNDFFKQL
jgi:fumarate hydratase, class I